MIDKSNWCIKITKENKDSVINYINEKHNKSWVGDIGFYYGVKNTYHMDSEAARYEPFTNVITFEEFKDYILNEKQEIKMKFKNKFTVQGNESLLKAFEEETKKIGWVFRNKINWVQGANTSIIYEGNATDSCNWANHTGSCKVYTLPNDWDKALELAKEVIEEIPEYVELLEEYCGYKKGDIAKVIGEEVNGYIVNVPNRVSFSGYSPNVWYGKGQFKPSTKEAYEAQQVKTLVIGDKDYRVNISKDKILLNVPGGEYFDIMILKNMLNPVFVNCAEKLNSYKVEFKEFNTIEERIIKIGCSYFSPKEIQLVVDTYKSLNP
jgi:hypothetical protein